MPTVLIIVLQLKLAGPVIVTQDYNSLTNCKTSAEYLAAKIPDAEIQCLPK